MYLIYNITKEASKKERSHYSVLRNMKLTEEEGRGGEGERGVKPFEWR